MHIFLASWYFYGRKTIVSIQLLQHWRNSIMILHSSMKWNQKGGVWYFPYVAPSQTVCGYTGTARFTQGNLSNEWTVSTTSCSINHRGQVAEAPDRVLPLAFPLWGQDLQVEHPRDDVLMKPSLENTMVQTTSLLRMATENTGNLKL